MSQIIIGGFNVGGSTTVQDANGCTWHTENLTGWGPTNTTLQITQKERADGGWPSEKYRTPRTVSAVSVVDGPSVAAVAASVNALYAAMDGFPVLSVDEGLGPLWVNAEQQYGPVPTWNGAYCEVSWQLEVADSRRFGQTYTGSTGLPSLTGGLTVPHTVPFAINSTIVSGNVVLNNPGTATGPVTITIYGPITGPVITHVGSGLSLVFAASLTLGAGEFLVIDMDNRKALAQGQSSRSLYITTRGWSGFDKGGNTWALSASTYSAGASMTVSAIEAWL
jgi:hypothetical protein